MRKKTNIIPEMNLFNTRKVNVLRLKDRGLLGSRGHEYTYGLDYILNEANANITKEIFNINEATEEKLLCSLTSPLDIYRLIDTIDEKPRNVELIIGGQGAFPVWPILSVSHKVALGRCEKRAVDIIWGKGSNNVLHSVKDTAQIGQALSLVPGEQSVGCKGRCKFCQYSATHKIRIGHDYSPGHKGNHVVEDRWSDISSKRGNQTTALDGWSEYTRKMVSKPVEDREIISVLSRILNEITGIMRLKVFQIVGYPWESPKSLRDDIAKTRDILSRVKGRDDGKSRIMLVFTVTPFSPEPLTKMQNEPANISVAWRDILLHDDNRCVYDSPHLNAFILPQIPGPTLLAKRVAVNRMKSVNALREIYTAKTIEQIVSICGQDIFEKQRGHYLDSIIV